MEARGQHIAVAVSGGGHRATLFALGALLYLVDAGKGPELATVSSVSGGSLANAHLGLTCDLTTATPDEVWAQARTLTSQVAGRGTVWASPLTYAFFAVVAAVLLAAVVVSFLVPAPLIALTWVVAVVVVGFVAQRRSWIAAKAFDRALFHGKVLEDMAGAVDHVICSADLQTAEATYFSGRFVHSFRLGWGRPGGLPVARAVQASAALPGAFNVATLPTARHQFPAPVPFPTMKLSDGGVYDNMGTEWPLGLADRLARGGPPGPGPAPKPIDELVVVNSSAAQGIVERRSVRTPVLGEITTLLAVKDVLYDQTTAVRRRLLDLRFRVSRQGMRGGIHGAMVQIDRDPYELPRFFIDEDDPRTDPLEQRALDAVEAVDALGHDAEWWRAEAKANRGVKTALSKIPADRAAALVRHAYVLTMVNTHVLLDYPLRPVPDESTFRSLVR